jgi:cleavage and polyadenylation specificity factor subunit 1
MQCYAELTPPTAVTHAVSLPFLSSKSNNLVVAKASLLQIFELKSTITEVTSGSKDDVANLDLDAEDINIQRTEHTSKLVLVGEYPLSGTVISLARVKTLDTKAGGESLLLAFRDAKLSLVEWDPEYHNLNTISIHYYEGHDLGAAPWSPELDDCCNFLTADPSSRCAALKFGVRNLAILPFRQLGDDLVEDYDPDLDDPMDRPLARTKTTNGDGEHAKSQTPYAASFVLPLTALDPSLTNPVHLAFLHEYREPTFGIISSSRAPAASLLAERKDILIYTVFTLDLEQKASTTLLSVPGIPYDVSKVVPLPLPVGGALLMGGNEIIHVDQAGKTNAVGVNEFARACTSFSMADQSDLALRLEGCTVEQLSPDTGDVLIILSNGDLVILTFTLDGRSVSGMSLQLVCEDRGGKVITCAASCATNLGRGRMFVGGEEGDSVLLGWASKTAQLSRKRSHTDMLADDGDSSFDEADLDDLDDDLYDNSESPTKKSTISLTGPSDPGAYTFRIHDTMISLAPMKDVTFVNPTTKGSEIQTSVASGLVASTGRGKAGAISILKREVEPQILKQTPMSAARGLWAVSARKPVPKGMKTTGAQDSEANIAADAEYDQYLVVCKSGENGNEDSVTYKVNGTNLEEFTTGEFEREDACTTDVGILAKGTKIVQVLASEVRIYDSELGLSQIIPMEDEETGAELRIINTSFADPYLLVLRDDSTAKIFKADEEGEVEEVESELFSSTQWLSGCLYKPSTPGHQPLVYLLTVEGGLQVCSWELTQHMLGSLLINSRYLMQPISKNQPTLRRVLDSFLLP